MMEGDSSSCCGRDRGCKDPEGLSQAATSEQS